MALLRYTASALFFIAGCYILYCGYLYAKQNIPTLGLFITVTILIGFMATMIAVAVYTCRSFIVGERVSEHRGKRAPRKKAE